MIQLLSIREIVIDLKNMKECTIWFLKVMQAAMFGNKEIQTSNNNQILANMLTKAFTNLPVSWKNDFDGNWHFVVFWHFGAEYKQWLNKIYTSNIEAISNHLIDNTKYMPHMFKWNAIWTLLMMKTMKYNFFKIESQTSKMM